MGEDSLSGWSTLSGLSQGTSDTSSLLGATGFAQSAGSTNTYGGSVGPSALNGYPVFSSGQAGLSSPSGYVNANPVDATPSMTPVMGRQGGDTPQPAMGAPTPPAMNPWNIKSSSTSGAFDYPLPGSSSPPPNLNTA